MKKYELFNDLPYGKYYQRNLYEEGKSFMFGSLMGNMCEKYNY